MLNTKKQNKNLKADQPNKTPTITGEMTSPGTTKEGI